MESLSNTPLLEFDPNTLNEVRKLYGMDRPGEMADAVNILDQWIKQQDHFIKKDFSKDYLERIIIMCKGSIERAKKRIDKLCTLKTLSPKFFMHSNIKELSLLLDSGLCTLLPKLTKDYNRVLLIKVKNTNFTAVQFVQIFYIYIIIAEYIKAHDYCSGFIIVSDYRDVNVIDMVSKIDIVDLQKFLPIFTDGYGLLIKGLVWITESKVIYRLTNVVNSFLNAKVSTRVQVFMDLESFQNYIPKDILPLEYGGKDKPMEELHNNLLEVLSSKEHVEYMKEMNKAKTDESKRTVDVFNERYLGMPGTFRNLRVD